MHPGRPFIPSGTERSGAEGSLFDVMDQLRSAHPFRTTILRSELGEGPLIGVYWPRQSQGGSHELVVAP